MIENRKPEKNNRRHYFINHAFQGRFIVQFSLLAVMGCAAFGLALYLYSTQTLTTAFVNSRLRVMSTSDFLLPAIALIALGVTAAVSAAAAVRLLFFSHKIAGPLYRFEKSAQSIQEGKLDFHVKLRAGDQLQDVAQSMDEMISDLRGRTAAIKEQNERLKKLVDQARKTSGVPSEFVESLKDTQNKLDAVISHFQV